MMSQSEDVELHCHSNFSLLDGASHPEELPERAREIGMTSLAIADHDGLYGAVRFVKSCRSAEVKPIVGAEMTLEGDYHVLLLARDGEGYSNLCRLVSDAQLTHAKGAARLTSTTRPDPAIGSRTCSPASSTGLPSIE